uniref:Uncharacterized protein n=1 Tax=Lactuca sativa TaxID=4236 RepID=A0A9R1W8D4_LACSA|nr:hypothetical protein LSAT_V11C300144730 [Lactuca sativa]
MITREALDDEIAQDVQATLPNVIAYTYDVILGEYVGDMDGDEEYYEYSTPISNHDPSIRQHSYHTNNSVWKDCSYKTFMNYRPSAFNKEIDPILWSMWITETEGTFYTSKCADEDKMIYAAIFLKREAIH